MPQIQFLTLPVGWGQAFILWQKENQLLKCTIKWYKMIENVQYMCQLVCVVCYVLYSEYYKHLYFIHPYRYESFDFHAECRHLRWDRLSMLTDRLAHEQDEFGYFLLTRDGTLVALQDGVFRTNCVDCLDRTNVVQSMLARRSLTQIMQVHDVNMKILKFCVLH